MTLFMVAHRLSILGICDRVMVESRFQALEAPEQLRQTNGFFQEAVDITRQRQESDVPLLQQLRTLARRTVEESLDAVILRELPHGFDACFDITRRKGDLQTVFDVGANRGQSAAVFREVWPAAHIYCFEPFAATFQELLENTAHDERTSCFHTALGAETGSVEVVLEKDTDNNSLRRLASTTPDVGTGTEVVAVSRLDDFCRQRGIAQVDLVKVDTEGYDLEVLKGARAMLEDSAISFVQVEAGMTSHNSKHVPFAAFQDYLEPLGYSLFGIYGQQPEWDGEARLRYADPVFVSPRDQSLPARAARLGLVRRQSMANLPSWRGRGASPAGRPPTGRT